ncbi:NfeD family protein [Pseudomonas sp. V1]|uniref:NfeD family protein n=1 Tax=Pseudomonas arcuscaelestis TaxID=2710591 RepID=UPI00193EDBAA|nr:NfeD family protein [Pseudomonas arcuscaelestis]MBM3105772.1 NfeD family protein [Pseudomonas arcuscaelestis]
MMDFLLPVTLWHWLVLAIALLIVEVFVGGWYIIWFGIAAAVTGFIVALLPDLPLAIQGIVFSVLGVVACIVWWRMASKRITTDAASTLNSRGSELVGRTFVVKESIVTGRGTIAVGDSTWPAAGPDIPAGTTVIVRRLDGIYCQVEPV